MGSVFIAKTIPKLRKYHRKVSCIRQLLLAHKKHLKITYLSILPFGLTQHA